jgi:hypothetical protein
MTTHDPESFDTLHEGILRFLGAFSATQSAIDLVIRRYLRQRMPALGPILEKQFLNRISDDQRRRFFTAFAAEVAYEGDLTHFDEIYRRANQLRDLIGHSLAVAGPVHSAGKPPSVAVASNGKRDLVPDPLLPGTFTRITADCEWIAQHIRRAGYAARLQVFIDVLGNPAEPPIPATLPEGGEPLA